MTTNTAIREFLADQNDVGTEFVKNGAEANEEEAGDYYGNDDAWLVFGKMPNSIETGWYFAGYYDDIKRHMHDYANRPQ